MPSSVPPNTVAVEYDPFGEAGELARVVSTTDAQREIWLADSLGHEASLAFNESVSLRLGGNLDTAALKAALRGIVDRHEALRSTLSADGLELFVASQSAIALDECDLAALDDEQKTLEFALRRREAVELPFNLTDGPLIRATLLRVSNLDHILILTCHHVVCDGWSFGVIVRELLRLYTASRDGQSPGIPPADGFAEYSMWTTESDQLAQAATDEAYWVAQFANDVPVLDLPVDRPRPPVRQFESDREDVLIPAELVAQLRKAAAKSGASLFSLLLGFFGSLLARLSAAESVVVGMPAAGQNASGRERLVGHCVNLLPIRLNLDLNQSARDCVGKTQRSVLDAYDHQQVTFGSILSKLRLERDPSRLPLVSVQFNLDQRIAPEDLAQPGLDVTLDTNARAFENFELFVNATQAPEGIVLETQYSTSLFDAGTIRRWMEIYRDALARFVVSPTKSLRELFIPTAADLELIARQNRTDAVYDTSAVVHSSIAAVSARSGQSPAILCGNDTLSYMELDARSNRLARVLRSRGVGRGNLVGLCLPRTADMVIGQLAVLKAGAAYVPLDPAFPPDRLAYMAEDAKLSLLLTTSALSNSVVWSREGSIWVDADADSIAQHPTTALEPDAERDAQPLDPAYVIYTSGSTGKPKGVVVHHRAVVNFLASMAKQPGMKAGDRVVAVTTLSFDIAVLELLLPLFVGATVVLASRDQAIDGSALKSLLEQSKASLMQATPATWRLLIEAGWRASPPFKALVGGEGLPQDLARELVSRVGELWNMYGPTETTVWSTCWKVDANAAAIRIGTPIDNTQMHVLDEKMQPCPIGVAGEIFIGGDGVTLGYLGLPKLTDERFIADPFRPGPDHRLYRTGDRGRWCADGQLEHLGRLDFQVKVRGFRIELGEIESRLAAHATIAQNVVVVREDQPGDVRLVAYLVAKAPVPDAGELKKFLRTHLPEYMLPQHFVTLDALPLTPNGKVDRKRLPTPTASGEVAARGARVEPRNDLELKVLQAMEGVLNQKSLSMTDDFFSLGGHSLLAARLIGQINRTLGLQLGLRVLFESPTAEKIARVIATEQGANAPRRAPIKHRANQASAPLTLMQERIHFIEQMQPGRVVYNAPSAHRFRGPMNLEAFNRAFVEMTRRQTVLRTAVVETADGYVQRVDDSVDTSLLPVEDLTTVPEADRERVLLERIEASVAHSFDLAIAPLFRARLFKMDAEDHAMLFMPHHVIWDGSSFDIFYDELSTLYEAFIAGKASPLPPLQVTYGDFAQWHREWMQSDEIAGQMGWWKQQFASFPELAEPYSDLPRRAAATGNGGTEFLHIPSQRAEEIREIARRTGSTVNIVLLSVYSALMSQWLRDPNPAVGIPVRGRPASELEATMGFFNNMVPLRLPVAMANTALDWIRKVRQHVTEAFANQDVPFEMLAQESTRLYQVMFTLQDARHRRTHWGQLNHTRIPVMQKGATEDINLWLIEVPNGIEGGVQYNADLFLPGTAAALRDRFLELLGRLVANPEASLEQLLAVRQDEEAMLAAWSTPAPKAAVERDAIDALWERIRANPDRTAVSRGGARLTNKQLCGQVERAERLLRSALGNVVAGSRNTVAIGSTDTLVHLAAGLAATRLGLRCVSFDTTADSEVVFERPDLVAMVWDPGVTAAVPSHVLQIDAGEIVAGSPVKGASTSRSNKRVAATAVALERAMLCAWLDGVGKLAALGEGSRVLCFEGPARVHQWLQALLALATGGELLLASSDLSRDGAGLAALVREERVTYMSASATVLQRLLSTRTGVLPKVVQVDVTESTPELVTGFLEAGTRVISSCSPSDIGLPVAAAVVSDVRECRTFGRPLLPLKVKDAAGRLAFVQMPGELCVGSPARGTQSLVRWRNDGQLHYLGEIDGAAYIDGERVSRENLAVRLALEGPATRNSSKAIVPPRNAIEKAVADIWCELLRIREVSVEDNFFDLGGHSLLGVQMLGQLERHFGVNLPLSTLLQRQTCAALAELLGGTALTPEKTESGAWRPLVEIQKGSTAKPPLFCIHAVGGNVLQYRRLANALPKDQAVYGLQSIGLDGLTRPLESVEEMCRIYVTEVRRVQPQGPYYLCGGSMGGTLAFEMARQFEVAGERVALLALFDTGGPEVKQLSGQEHSATGSVRRLVGAMLSGSFNLKHSVAVRWRERSDALTAKWHWMRDLPVPQEVRWRVVEAANYRASAAYVERPYNGLVTLFRALDEKDQRHLSADLGWGSVAKGGVEIISLPGTHREFIEQPDLPPAVRAVLLKAQASAQGEVAGARTQARKFG